MDPACMSSGLQIKSSIATAGMISRQLSLTLED
jgi:hypothetical protein